MRLAMLAALMVMLGAVVAARAVREQRGLAAGEEAPPFTCDPWLCLPQRRSALRNALGALVGDQKHYCGAPAAYSRTACVDRSAPAPAPARRTTLGAFCEGAGEVKSRTIGDEAAQTLYLPHDSPAYRKEMLWCKPRAGAIVASEVFAAEIEAQGLPPWAENLGPISPPAAGADAVPPPGQTFPPAYTFAEYFSTLNIRRRAAKLRHLAVGVLGTQPAAALPDTASAPVAAARSCGEYLGRPQGARMGGVLLVSTMTCAVTGGTATITLSLDKAANAGAFKALGPYVLDVGAASGVPFAGARWPAVAALVGEARAHDEADPRFVMTTSEWRAGADEISAAIAESGGVPRALRAFVYWYLSAEPAWWSRKDVAGAASAYDGGSSVRAHLDSLLPAVMDSTYNASCREGQPEIPYSSKEFDPVQAQINAVGLHPDCSLTKGEQAAKNFDVVAADCTKKKLAISRLLTGFKKEYPDDAKLLAAWKGDPAKRPPCGGYHQIWADLDERNSLLCEPVPYVWRERNGMPRSAIPIMTAVAQTAEVADAKKAHWTNEKNFPSPVMADAAHSEIKAVMLVEQIAFSLYAAQGARGTFQTTYFQGNADFLAVLMAILPPADVVMVRTHELLALQGVAAGQIGAEAKDGFEKAARSLYSQALAKLPSDRFPAIIKSLSNKDGLDFDKLITQLHLVVRETLSASSLLPFGPYAGDELIGFFCDQEMPMRWLDLLLFAQAAGVPSSRFVAHAYYAAARDAVLRVTGNAPLHELATILGEVINHVLFNERRCISELGRLDIATFTRSLVADIKRESRDAQTVVKRNAYVSRAMANTAR